LDNSCESVSTDFHNNAFSVSIFPNPVEDFLEIKLKDFDEINAEIKIHNQLGNIFLEKKLNTSQLIISTNHLSKGIYFLKIETEKGSIIKKFIQL